MELIEQAIVNRTNEILKMKLHESLSVNKWISIFRVLGGWIYLFTYPPDEGTDCAVFVPEVINVECKFKKQKED